MTFKYTVEIETDNIFESEGSFGDAIVDAIAAQIIAGENIKEKVENKINAQIDKTVTESIDKACNDMMVNLLDRTIYVTDRYGDEKESGTIREIVKGRFEKYLTTKVDKNGKDERYGGIPRAEWFAKNIIEKEMNEFTKRTVKDIKAAVESKLTDELQLAVGNEIVNSIGVKNIIDRLQLPEKK